LLLTLGEKHRLGVSKGRVLRKTLEHKNEIVTG